MDAMMNKIAAVIKDVGGGGQAENTGIDTRCDGLMRSEFPLTSCIIASRCV